MKRCQAMALRSCNPEASQLSYAGGGNTGWASRRQGGEGGGRDRALRSPQEGQAPTRQRKNPINEIGPMDKALAVLRGRVTCPHCWEGFPPVQALWIAEHPDLIGDPRLGRDQPQRFLPTRFDIAGAAIDAKGFACHGLACPRCHLPIPRVLFETEALFLSVLGAPACGKSYFMASMTWRLRSLLPQRFALAFGDGDPLFNHRLNESESIQFLNPDPDALVAIAKTETSGDLYSSVLHGDQVVNYLRPFIFSIKPLEGHPSHASAAAVSKVLCLYDNAGESFLPGADTAANPVTRHLARSQAILFLFDPTQDVRFRRACAGKTNDPQMAERTRQGSRESTIRQETILIEAAQRIRRYAGLAENAKHSQPLIVAVTKYDCWAPLLSPGGLPEPWKPNAAGSLFAVRHREIEQVSLVLRDLLWRLSPEFVAAAEGFANEVLYVPVSATGCSPEVDPQTGAQGFRPRNIRPIWVEVPLLYVMSRWMKGLVCYFRHKPGGSNHKPAVPTSAMDSPPSSSPVIPTPPPPPRPVRPGEGGRLPDGHPPEGPWR